MIEINVKSQISTKTLNAIKENLPYGSIADISRKLKLSKSTVSRVINGKSKNKRVIKLALKIVEKNQQEIQQLEKQLEALS